MMTPLMLVAVGILIGAGVSFAVFVAVALLTDDPTQE